MAFNQDTFAPVGPQSTAAPSVFTYETPDTILQLTSAGYFIDKAGQLEEGDIINTVSGDGFVILGVTATTSTAEVMVSSTATLGEPVASTANATTTPLSGGATYTGDWEISPRSMAVVQSFADAAGTLYFDFSIDGVNADSSFPVGGFDVSANIPEVSPAAVGGRYFRVRYVNGSAAQTVFRLGAFYSEITNFYAPLNQSLGLDAPAIMTRNPLPWLDYSRGLFSGITSIKKFGRNPSVGTTFEPVDIGGIYRTPQSSAATTVRIKSGGNAADTAAGAGARQITLQGTDENFNEVTDTLATAGASASASTTTTFTRIYRAFVSQSGTYATSSTGSHVGDIVVENTAGTQDWLTIESTNFPKGQSEIGAYTVAAGKTGHVKLRNLSIDSGKTIDLAFFSRSNCDETAAPYTAMRAQSVVNGISGGSIEAFGEVDIPFGPYVGPTDLGFMARVSAGTASVAVEFEIFIIDE